MSHFLVYWKTFWDYGTDKAKKHVLSNGYGTDARKFSPDDNLWIIATDRDDSSVWKLMQLIHVKDTKNNRAIADTDNCLFFEANKQPNIENILKKLKFHSGKQITKSGAGLGMHLEIPRRLSIKDIEILDKFIKRSFKKTRQSANDPTLSFPDQAHRKKVEKAAIKEATSYLESMNYTVEDVSRENRGYDLLAERKQKPKELHVEVKGTSSNIPQFFISRKEKYYMSNKMWRLLLVTNALSSPVITFMTEKEACVKFMFSPFEWLAKLK